MHHGAVAASRAIVSAATCGKGVKGGFIIR
jgi:hypothetical protein